ncbi:MAG: energy-coupling factor transporter ATPase [Clostridia bacterium]|nr:energy-coupling factor transporter ATPase [Clostridia bacterium]
MPLVVEKLNHIYMKGGPYETQALSDISFTIQDGEFVGLIGHTGSGKSTLVQHLNGLLQPTSGRVLVDGTDLADKTADRKQIRCKVGLVFQYAENQLFEETVAKDIAFGPKNLGLDAGEIDRRVREAMRQVSLDYDRISGKSVFDLSGGQMRRVAIAGVLAMKPSVLVLDEPCAGLDPHGREEILGLIRRLHRESGVTIVMVSHSMDDVAQLAERVMVMHRGHLVMDGRPEEIFTRGEELRKMGLDVPQVVQLGEQLRARGYEIPEQIYRMEDMRELLIRLLKKGEYHAQ